MIRTNTRLSKLSAARVEFGRRGMLKHDVLTSARIDAELEVPGDEVNELVPQAEDGEEVEEEDDELMGAAAADGPRVESFVELCKRAGAIPSVLNMA